MAIDEDVSTTSVAADQLRSIIERVERLEEEKKEVAEQIKEVFAEAKANGFDTKTLRKVISLRKKALEERQEEEAMLDLYLHALGMIPDPGQ
ncbi:MAG: DUF2312 domain-containing protein [Pikeienuella sp.]